MCTIFQAVKKTSVTFPRDLVSLKACTANLAVGCLHHYKEREHLTTTACVSSLILVSFVTSRTAVAVESQDESC